MSLARTNEKPNSQPVQEAPQRRWLQKMDHPAAAAAATGSQTDSTENNHDRWLVSYADFITLLFAFFVVLYATSEADLKRQSELQEKLKAHFSSSQNSGYEYIPHPGDLRYQNESSTEDSTLLPGGQAGGFELRDMVIQKLRAQLTEQEYNQYIEAIQSDAKGLRIQLSAQSFFASSSADLLPEAQHALERIGVLLRSTHRKILIEGHTDDLPIRTSTYPSNWELSGARTARIARFLNEQLGIDTKRIVAVAHASNHPLYPNTDEKNRAKNRRIEFVLLNNNLDQ